MQQSCTGVLSHPGSSPSANYDLYGANLFAPKTVKN